MVLCAKTFNETPHEMENVQSNMALQDCQLTCSKDQLMGGIFKTCFHINTKMLPHINFKLNTTYYIRCCLFSLLYLKDIYFLSKLLTSFYMPIINRPTRITTHSATLIDNIFTNAVNL